MGGSASVKVLRSLICAYSSKRESQLATVTTTPTTPHVMDSPASVTIRQNKYFLL